MRRFGTLAMHFGVEYFEEAKNYLAAAVRILQTHDSPPSLELGYCFHLLSLIENHEADGKKARYERDRYRKKAYQIFSRPRVDKCSIYYWPGSDAVRQMAIS